VREGGGEERKGEGIEGAAFSDCAVCVCVCVGANKCVCALPLLFTHLLANSASCARADCSNPCICIHITQDRKGQESTGERRWNDLSSDSATAMRR
jgi:hypothetical protein